MSAVRTLSAADAADVRALAHSTFEGTRYLERILEQVDLASSGKDPECTGLVAVGVTGVGVAAFALHGLVAGADGVMKMHVLAGAPSTALESLVDVLVERARTVACRMVLCELPVDAPFGSASAALGSRLFVREGLLEDFFSDGIGLELLVRRL